MLEFDSPAFVIMQPLAMVVPTEEGIYAKSRLRQPFTIPVARFIERYADYPIVALVSFASDGVSNPEPMTVYGYGLDCWYWPVFVNVPPG